MALSKTPANIYHVAALPAVDSAEKGRTDSVASGKADTMLRQPRAAKTQAQIQIRAELNGKSTQQPEKSSFPDVLQRSSGNIQTAAPQAPGQLSKKQRKRLAKAQREAANSSDVDRPLQKPPMMDGPQDSPIAGQLQLHASDVDAEQAELLKNTVLAPFFERLQQDHDRIIRLEEEKATLIADLKQSGNRPNAKEQCGQESAISKFPQPRGIKRKVLHASPMKIGDVTNGNDEHTIEGHLLDLANQISKDLDEIIPNETIHLCGLTYVKMLSEYPDVVLAAAQEKLHTWPYHQVATCWRRLYEDASLSKAVCILRDRAEILADENSSKRTKLDSGETLPRGAIELDDDWVTDIVKILDMGISLSGAPGRSSTFEAVFQQLENFIKDESMEDVPKRFPNVRAPSLESEHAIERSAIALNFMMFQRHLDKFTTPLIIPGTLNEWPAARNWQNPGYFLRMTLGGRRLVPVEVGKSYTDEDWSQTIMSFGEFMQTYVLPQAPEEIGYLAQHDLFAQIPALKADIIVPDYCHTAPPDTDAAVARTSGLTNVPELSEPLLNAWLGPKGTRTPLHTDPYHNILCQVVGYKYVRLYAPNQTPKLYPRGIDEKGINMENTSQVDMSPMCTRSLGGAYDVDSMKATHRKFPLFEDATYVEGVLAPGECLYIPLGWWHYIESLTTSFSVSFWWN